MRLAVLRSTAICWFGNEHLFAADESHLWEVSLKSAFRGVERLEFIRPMAHQFSAPGAAFVLGTKMWYRRLKADGIESLRLHLPISLLEPLPAAYGVVSDSSSGSDMWVQTPKSTARDLEFAARKFAAWSLPRPQPSADLSSQLEVAIAAAFGEFGSSGTLLARRLTRLADSFKEQGAHAEGFDDLVPGEFSRQWRNLAARGLRTAAILGAEDLVLKDQPAAEQIDEIWQLGLRLLEAVSAEVASERALNAAA
jgi:hypothetical protein